MRIFFLTTRHSLTYLVKMVKVIILLHVFLSAAHLTVTAAWSSALCHLHSRLCSSEKVTSHTRYWTPVRPAVASVILLACRSLFRRSRFDPPSPGTQVPRFNSPCHHSAAPFPPLSPGRRARPCNQRVVLSHTRAARSSLPCRARRHFNPSPLFSPLFLMPSTLYTIE